MGAASLDAGQAWLDTTLGELLATPFPKQRRSPLEVFQEAMRFPTDDLSAQGVEPPERDVSTNAALPGDWYDLAPASSQALGGGVWEAHLAWGAAKAASIVGASAGGGTETVDEPEPIVDRRPAVGLLGTDLMDRTKIVSAVENAGYRVHIWRRVDDIEQDVVVALVDLNHSNADDAVRRLSQTKAHVVAFGPHVDDLALARAGSLGADEVLARSVFFRRLPQMLPTLI